MMWNAPKPPSQLTERAKESRDTFAKAALTGMLASNDWFGKMGHWKSLETMTNTYAIEAYHFADAMMKARKD